MPSWPYPVEPGFSARFSSTGLQQTRPQPAELGQPDRDEDGQRDEHRRERAPDQRPGQHAEGERERGVANRDDAALVKRRELVQVCPVERDRTTR